MHLPIFSRTSYLQGRFFFMCETITSDGRAKLLYPSDCTRQERQIWLPYFFYHQKCTRVYVVWHSYVRMYTVCSAATTALRRLPPGGHLLSSYMSKKCQKMILHFHAHLSFGQGAKGGDHYSVNIASLL